MPQWFLDRGFSLATAKTFSLGYVNGALHIPVANSSGGWVLRHPPGRQPKYENSSGLREPYIVLRDGCDILICVEGPLDALWAWEAGYSACALLGGRLTSTILERVIELDPGEICLAFDADLAGAQTTQKVGQALAKAGYRLTTITIPPPAKDIQELTKGEFKVAFQDRTALLVSTKTVHSTYR